MLSLGLAKIPNYSQCFLRGKVTHMDHSGTWKDMGPQSFGLTAGHGYSCGHLSDLKGQSRLQVAEISMISDC